MALKYFTFLITLLHLTFPCFSQDILEEKIDADYSFYFESAESKAAKILEGLSSDTKKEEELQEELLISSCKQTNQLFNTSKVILNSTGGDYLNKIKSKLLQNYPSLDKLIHIYIIEDVTMNAFAVSSNDIFINTGLLAQLEDEGQLAFIISHELVHIINKHSIESFIDVNEQMNSILSNGKMDEYTLLEEVEYLRIKHHLLSRDHELKADLDGFDLFTKAGYPPSSAVTALNQLKNDGANMYPEVINPNFIWLNKELFDWDVTINKSELIKEKKDTLYSTHPELGIRISRINSIVKDTTLPIIKNNKEFDELKAASQKSLLEELARKHEFLSLFLITAKKIHDGDTSLFTHNMFAYALQGIAISSARTVPVYRLTSSESLDFGIEFYDELDQELIWQWCWSLMNQVLKPIYPELADQYILSMSQNIINLKFGNEDNSNLQQLFPGIDANVPLVHDIERDELVVSDIQFELSLRALPDDQQHAYYRMERSVPYDSGEIAITKIENLDLRSSKNGMFEPKWNKIKKMDKKSIAAGLEISKLDGVTLLSPNDQTYKGHDFNNYKYCLERTNELLEFESFHFVPFSYSNSKINSEDIPRYSLYNLNVSFFSNTILGKSFLSVFYGPFIMPFYFPQLCANAIIDAKRVYSLIIIFDIKKEELCYWERQTTTEPYSYTLAYKNCITAINNFMKP